jgi:hypothetical protein
MAHCGGNVDHASGGADAGGPDGAVDATAPLGDAAEGGSVVVPATPLVVDVSKPRPRTGNWSVNYWMWSPTYGDSLPGTEDLVAALKPTYMRVGGYNNDANTPDPFDSAQLDAMVTYARAIGAEPILQVPLLADITGAAPTAAEAAAMVTYANGTQGYKIKYFSIGNEPDIYSKQGLPSDMTLPAIPGFTPAQYCATARDYVTAMKAAATAADPSTPITIVGPDLAYQYQPPNDWLTPILQTCGDLFDVVSIHRYPFSSAVATLSAAQGDPANFRTAITAVRALMSAAGVGDKPLALTEMNIAYDETITPMAASPGTIPSALWMADVLGSAIDLDLWTTAVWDISDPDDWSLGIIGLPPTHTPRPEYYAYALYADHFGPTLANVTSAPQGVHAYASRNAAGNATEVILANWSSAAQVISFQVSGLPSAPIAPVYTIAPLSIAAVEIPDQGEASAVDYGETQHAATLGPAPLMQGAVAIPPVDSGAPAADAAFVCPSTPATTAGITTGGASEASTLLFGAVGAQWGVYSFAGPGQPPAAGSLSSDSQGLAIALALDPAQAPSAAYSGVGLYFNSAACLDASAYTGVQFDFDGTVTGCSLTFGANDSEDLSAADDANRGGCEDSTCYGPSKVVATAGPMTIQLPFSDLAGGMPVSPLDTKSVVSIQWELLGPGTAPDGGDCTANFTVKNVAFY